MIEVSLCAFPRYLRCDVVVTLAWSNDSKSYAGGIVATGRASHAGQVEGMTQRERERERERYPGSPDWGLDGRLTTCARKKCRLLHKVKCSRKILPKTTFDPKQVGESRSAVKELSRNRWRAELLGGRMLHTGVTGYHHHHHHHHHH
jgi:hypothetical protein